MVNKIKKTRLEKGISQHELAQILNISVSYLNKVERGNRIPSLMLAVRIANVLDISVDELFFLDK